MQDAGAGKGWGVGEAVAVWEQGTFLVLEPAFQAGKHVGGGGLMALMLNLFALPHALEASLVDFCSGVGEGWYAELPLEEPDRNFTHPRKSKVLHPLLTNPLCDLHPGDLCAVRGNPPIAAGS